MFEEITLYDEDGHYYAVGQHPDTGNRTIGSGPTARDALDNWADSALGGDA